MTLSTNTRRRRPSVAGCALLLTASSVALAGALAPVPASAAATTDLTITSVSIDTSTTPRDPAYGGSIRQQVACSVAVDFDDATPPEAGHDGYYELEMAGQEYGIASASTYDEVPTSLSTYGCYGFTDGVSAELTLSYYEWDESVGKYGDYVRVSTSEPVDFTYAEVAHPSKASMDGDGVTHGQLEAGLPVTISFTGEWDPAATVTAQVSATKGWTSLKAQDADQVVIPTTWDAATQTFTFTPDPALVGRSAYVTVKGSLGDDAHSDWMYTWAPGLVVDPGPRPSKKSWVDTFGKKTKKSDFFLSTTPAKASRSGAKAGVRFIYQGWWGKQDFYSWHSNQRASGIGEFGGCPTVAQHVRVLAFVPGRSAVSRTITLPPPGCRAASGGAVRRSAPGGSGTWG